MAKRLFDLCLAVPALICLAPLMLVTAVIIKLSDPGPALYRAKRAGRGNTPFVMFKFRSMRVGGDKVGSITAQDDSRVFATGRLLRKLKIDELPQLINVVRGEMSIVGPRPETLDIVEKYYAPAHLRTLDVFPGLTSPGSIYNYTHGEKLLSGPNPEREYVEKLLPTKLALELVYIERTSVWYDITIILRTVWVILAIAAGKQNFRNPTEYDRAIAVYLYEPALENRNGAA